MTFVIKHQGYQIGCIHDCLYHHGLQSVLLSVSYDTASADECTLTSAADIRPAATRLSMRLRFSVLKQEYITRREKQRETVLLLDPKHPALTLIKEVDHLA